MKKGFSLLELIFAIVVIGIIASFAIPKYLDTRDSAIVSTIKRDVTATVTSLQSFTLVNGSISKISDAITLSDSNWEIEDKKITDKSGCIKIELKIDDLKTLEITVDSEKEGICTKIRDSGLNSKIFNLF